MALPFSCHFLMFVDFGCGIEAKDFCIQAFGADTIHEERRRVGVSQGLLFPLTIFLRIPGTRQIIEIQETIPKEIPDAARPLFQSRSHAIMCIYTDDAVGTFQRAMRANAIALPRERYDNRRLYRVRDPYGYYWCIAPRNLIPKAIVPQASHAHYLLLVDHHRVRNALNWYTNAFGAVLLHEDATSQTLRFFLRLGTVERPLILEIVDTTCEIAQENESKEMILIYTKDVSGFMKRVGAAVDEAGQVVVLDSEEDNENPGNYLFCRIRDAYGYLWLIESSNDIPNELLNANN